MSTNYLKKAAKTPETETSTAQQVVTEMLANIEKSGEIAVKEYASKLDKWSGEIVMSDEAINAALSQVPNHVKKDIDFAVKQVYDFAIAQKNSIQSITTHEELVKTILFTETAKEQLKKGGSSLTKTDLIAIIIMIDLNKMNNLEYLKTLTVNDLNSIIRSIVYDTNRYMNKSSNLLITNNSNNDSSKPTQVKSNPVTTKSSKKPEIMDIESTQVFLIEDKQVKKASSKKTKEDKDKDKESKNNSMALVISK